MLLAGSLRLVWARWLSRKPLIPFDKSSEVVVITGGSGGLGCVLAKLLALEGIRVAILDIVGNEELDDCNRFNTALRSDMV